MSLVLSAVTSVCPATATVPKLLELATVFVIVNVSPTIAVLIPVPPDTVNVSVAVFAVVLPLSELIVANRF